MKENNRYYSINPEKDFIIRLSEMAVGMNLDSGDVDAYATAAEEVIKKVEKKTVSTYQRSLFVKGTPCLVFSNSSADFYVFMLTTDEEDSITIDSIPHGHMAKAIAINNAWHNGEVRQLENAEADKITDRAVRCVAELYDSGDGFVFTLTISSIDQLRAIQKAEGLSDDEIESLKSLINKLIDVIKEA